MQDDRPFDVQAMETLDRALAASGTERLLLLAEVVRLHRLAESRRAREAPGDDDEG
jgi:hypothetical protein